MERMALAKVIYDAMERIWPEGASWEEIGDHEFYAEVADAVLDVPEIKDALALYEQWLDSPSGPTLTTPEEVRAWFRNIRPRWLPEQEG